MTKTDKAFSRFQKHMELQRSFAARGMIYSGVYKSRGHGRGLPGRNYTRSGRNYPFSSARQDSRGGRYMALVHGFEIMQIRAG